VVHVMSLMWRLQADDMLQRCYVWWQQLCQCGTVIIVRRMVIAFVTLNPFPTGDLGQQPAYKGLLPKSLNCTPVTCDSTAVFEGALPYNSSTSTRTTVQLTCQLQLHRCTSRMQSQTADGCADLTVRSIVTIWSHGRLLNT
jgi:hypothetical protein